MQLTGQNNGGIASSAFVLTRKCNWLARTCIMNMRNATCVGTQISKVPTRVTLLFIPYTVPMLTSVVSPLVITIFLQFYNHRFGVGFWAGICKLDSPDSEKEHFIKTETKDRRKIKEKRQEEKWEKSEYWRYGKIQNSAVHRSRRAGAGVLTYFAGARAGAGVCSPPVKL